jgi:hypothetical protein
LVLLLGSVIATRLKIPPLLEVLVTVRRRRAERIDAPAGTPATSKRRNACMAVPFPPTILSSLLVRYEESGLAWLTYASAAGPKVN